MIEQAKHPIRVVARRTGLSPHVIRVWERRYGAVVPFRTETNRRLYTDADIRKLQILRRLIRAGRAIGQIANLPVKELEALLVADGGTEPAVPTASVERLETLDTPDGVLRVCMDRVEEMDPRGLEAALAHTRVNFTQPVVLEQIIIPLMEQVGDRWKAGTLKIVNEHMATATIRSFLGGMLANQHEHPGAPLLVITTPAGQHHEVGALAAAATASHSGWRVVYLGPNLPSEEIAAALKRHEARFLALSIVHPLADPTLTQDLIKLHALIGSSVQVLVGGNAASSYAATLDSMDATHFYDLASFRERLEAIQRAQFG